jgi:hypothetical protein
MGKLYRLFTSFWPNPARRERAPGEVRSGGMIVGIASAMFIWLFGWGQDYFHWSDPSGDIQLALFASFILGIVCGYKTKQ